MNGVDFLLVEMITYFSLQHDSNNFTKKFQVQCTKNWFHVSYDVAWSLISQFIFIFIISIILELAHNALLHEFLMSWVDFHPNLVSQRKFFRLKNVGVDEQFAFQQLFGKALTFWVSTEQSQEVNTSYTWFVFRDMRA